MHPFRSREARRLAVLFAIVYFAQGMVYLPDQVIAIVFKERGLSAGQLAAFTWVVTTVLPIDAIQAAAAEVETAPTA